MGTAAQYTRSARSSSSTAPQVSAVRALVRPMRNMTMAVIESPSATRIDLQAAGTTIQPTIASAGGAIQISAIPIHDTIRFQRGIHAGASGRYHAHAASNDHPGR